MCECAVTALAAQVGSKTDKTSGVRTAAFRKHAKVSLDTDSQCGFDQILGSAVALVVELSTTRGPGQPRDL